jgi:hypothetical protein
MSFKLSSFAKFFSRVSHKVEDDKKTSTSQFVTVTLHKTEKADSKNSGSKILQFFDRLFHSKKKAKENVDTTFHKRKAHNTVNTHIKEKKVNENALVDINGIATRTGAPRYFVMLEEPKKIPANHDETKLDQRQSDTSNSDLRKSSGKDDGTVSNAPKAGYAELDQRRNFIDSNEGRFIIDIANMGSCIDKPQQHFRSLPGLDLQKTLAHAFQIYYEEGKRIHEDSFATPGWGHEATAQSPEDLDRLKADLNKINAPQPFGKEVLQKAAGAIEGRISRLNEERQKEDIHLEPQRLPMLPRLSVMVIPNSKMGDTRKNKNPHAFQRRGPNTAVLPVVACYSEFRS